MSPKDFKELLKSVRQAGRIRRGEIKASKRFVVDQKNVSK